MTSLQSGLESGPWWVNRIVVTDEHVGATYPPCSCTPAKRQTLVRYGGRGGRSVDEAMAELCKKVSTLLLITI